ncbi:hypothetical protein NITHO_6400002 [Nitrolancea hollandica Lb]|uniref:Uncharacterized protein n=1 Tax=Nitrolancea hollandica Lb TaxID=1129897 RepID=I4EMR4_9BACT|nr:hypothetical protein NITHO_6400002 [Nitrolancea hollandica Lb]
MSVLHVVPVNLGLLLKTALYQKFHLYHFIYFAIHLWDKIIMTYDEFSKTNFVRIQIRMSRN